MLFIHHSFEFFSLCSEYERIINFRLVQSQSMGIARVFNFNFVGTFCRQPPVAHSMYCHVNTQFFALFHIFSPAPNRLRSFHLLAYKFLNGQKKSRMLCARKWTFQHTQYTHRHSYSPAGHATCDADENTLNFFLFSNGVISKFPTTKTAWRTCTVDIRIYEPTKKKKTTSEKKLRWKRLSKNNVGT